MASNGNSPNKGQGANEPDHQPLETDAANVDWMIISDISTRIGVPSKAKKEATPPPNNSPVPSAKTQQLNDDLEDLEWLKSIGLDEPIERSPNSKITANSQNKSDDVGNIDWLIVTDLKTRMDEPNVPSQVITPPAELNLADELGDALGINELDFFGDSNLSELESLDFGDSDSPVDDFDVNDLLNEIDITEGKIRELSQLAEEHSGNDLFDLNNASLDNLSTDNDWDQIANLSNEFNFQQDLQTFENDSLDSVSDSFVRPTKLAKIGKPELDNSVNSAEEFIDSSTPDNVYENFDDFQNEFIGDEVADELVNELALDQSVADDYADKVSLDSFVADNEAFVEPQELGESPVSEDLDGWVENDLGSEDIDGWVENDLAEEIVGKRDEFDDFEQVQLSAPVDSLAIDDEIWASSSTLENESSYIDADADNPFASAWEANNIDHGGNVDDAIWNTSSSNDSDDLSHTAIENVFASSEEYIGGETNDLEDWSAAIEAEISVNNEASVEWNQEYNEPQDYSVNNEASVEWNQEYNESAEYFTPPDESVIPESAGDLLENNLIEDIADFSEAANEPENLHVSEETYPDYSISQDYNLSNLDNEIDSNSDWENFSDAIGEQFTPSEFSTSLETFDNQALEPISEDIASSDRLTDDLDSSLTSYNDLGSIDSFIDENFDLDAFDEESFPEVTSSDLSNPNIATTLTSNRSNPPVDDFQDSVESPDMAIAREYIGDVEIAIEESLETDPFEEALAIDLLNGDISGIDNFKQPPVGMGLPPVPPSPNLVPNSASSASFAIDTNDHDFLDNFDLDSLDTELTGDDFDSGFAPAKISTGLNVQSPPPPIAPLAPPVIKQENITSPSLINPPPPPPFLPPLPPKRSPHQSKPLSQPPTSPNLLSNPPVSGLGHDDFDSFHGQSLSSRSEGAIDEGWTDLLDADTVLSGVLNTPTQPYGDMGGSMPPSSGNSRGRSAGNSTGSSPQAREHRPSPNPKRKDTGLPNLNDLGLEIHDDNTDWSGLLDSGDLSDNITSISNTSTQLPPRSRQVPVRSDLTGVSETRELPRDRRPMSSFGDATQARMSAPPDQIDFNRFTEDNYGSYGSEPPVEKDPAPSPSRTKITIPSVSIESLWQDYLKFPVIGLGAIAGAFLLYSLVNRPIFDLGLRWGLFKDASGKDFSNADFKGAKLDNVDFSKAILTGAKMQDASLIGANLQEANLDGVNFTNANLSRARLIQSSVIWSEFKNAQMNLVDLAGADLTRSNFSGAKMEGANLKGTKIGAQGTEKATKFSPTTLLAWQIVNEPKEGRNLADQDLSGLNLSFTSLRRANLTNVKLNYTDMTGTDLSGANLSGGQINGANLSGSKLNGINLSGVNFDKNKLPKTDEETVCPNGKKGPCKF
ncbi:pentapeptide repeat-containing protein [Pseudanabaena sp. FACHB-1998]|uniref:pentapeptide repeat-containing protein n=1 Tax=Pseudanabaena sp. FACHB-1998 TaxID=2692858 RepID=UPI001680A4A5|nr:pentapeptide repeat-containing protein [Pseudanabaena sp. FACHB-1998]MBD2178205.1 pentapeptide repeat-containing protein [Pseudanabaena sp. FACHB-1998]